MIHHKRTSLSPPLFNMPDRRPPQTAKESQGFRNRLKKMFRWGSQSMLSSWQPLELAPTVLTIMTDRELELEAANIRARYTHFRILIVGRANAGKTTLLKRVCNTKEDPVYNKVMAYRLRLILLSHHPSPPRQINPTSKVPTF